MSLADVRHWVFDMDGTLTVAVHDFRSDSRRLGDSCRSRHPDPPRQRCRSMKPAAKHAWLLEHERDLALGSKPAPGAVELVRELAGRGYRLGILTRNARELAHVRWRLLAWPTALRVEDVLGRDDAPPKPHPGGLLKLAEAWKVYGQRYGDGR